MLDVALILLSALAVFGAYILVARLVLWCLKDVLTLGVRAEKEMSVMEIASWRVPITARGRGFPFFWRKPIPKKKKPSARRVFVSMCVARNGAERR